jgi:hypothetical protein
MQQDEPGKNEFGMLHDNQEDWMSAWDDKEDPWDPVTPSWRHIAGGLLIILVVLFGLAYFWGSRGALP